MITRRLLAAFVLALAIAAGATTLTPAAPASAAQYNWGAIAYDWNGRTAWAVNYASEPAARYAVKARCGSQCGYFTFYNSCGAVAYTSDRRHSAWARGYSTRGGAERAALSRLSGPKYVAAYACTSR
ncbi:DUF4189 domain-containing protein [Gordonia sp. TBRC 11910]|uniref:DUF4189 domain-containing protein n=1 Tax=Gordonia asplenii TaxID=2725283 RepID=A0A848KXY0_9ACTN|nr:DUF4189 domain-containing protein [Gordonia asplenii]NMO01293.1 DUF4189 domain-containing protein [Gordonia asplenii]